MENDYNPDVLNCIANLSNDEVFTPPQLVNEMLDLLPAELFSNPNARFLDPFTKSGVFLREIVKRLDVGLSAVIPDRQERILHIMHEQVFGIALTELTSLLARRTVYCSKFADSEHSVGHFKTREGHILYTPMQHTWQNGRCKYCGASKEVYDRTEVDETYAYNFIHIDNPIKFFPNMTFDVIIGNPPYQLEDGGFGISARPIYHLFINQAKKLNPRYLSMIVPARWFAGGKGLDDFRKEMLTDNRIRIIHDYPQAYECFPGVQIKGGVCYFLWSRDERGDCEVITHKDNIVSRPHKRPHLEPGCDTFIRYNEAIDILNKTRLFHETSIISLVSSRNPFGLNTTFHGNKEGEIKLYENQGQSFVNTTEIRKSKEMISKYKVFIPRASSGSDVFPHPILGRAFIGEPNSVCSETYMYIGPFSSKRETENVISYINTRFFRFLVMLKKVTQDTTKSVYQFVPLQDFSESWTDEKLYAKYGLDEKEIAFIESMIRPME